MIALVGDAMELEKAINVIRVDNPEIEDFHGDFFTEDKISFALHLRDKYVEA